MKNPEIAVVQISAKSGGPGRGFFASPGGMIVTRLHLFDHAGEITVTRADGQKLSADFVQGDQEADLAILKVHGEKLPYLKLFDDDATPGMHMRILGSAGVTQSVFDQWESFGKEIGFAARLLPSDGGAPMLADDGRVMAVVRGPVEGHDSRYSATPAWRILKMMPMLGQKSLMPGKQGD